MFNDEINYTHPFSSYRASVGDMPCKGINYLR